MLSSFILSIGTTLSSSPVLLAFFSGDVMKDAFSSSSDRGLRSLSFLFLSSTLTAPPLASEELSSFLVAFGDFGWGDFDFCLPSRCWLLADREFLSMWNL